MARRRRSPPPRRPSAPRSFDLYPSQPSLTAATRDAPAVARAPVLTLPIFLSPLVSGRVLRHVEDRRAWNPESDPPARNLRKSVRRLRVYSSPNAKAGKSTWSKGSLSLGRVLSGGFARVSALPHRISFPHPESVLVCVRRRRRRETLFASGKAGKGRLRRPKWNAWSHVSCRR